jgi:hypothetical protein
MALIFEKSNKLEKTGEKLGFLFSYFLFTSVLYFMLFLFHKLPKSWSYFHVGAITLSITLLGLFLSKYLK